jgi:excisionase family DNA binding protein
MSGARFETSRRSSPRHAVKPAWLTVSQLARRWQLGRRTIYKFIDSGTLPVWQVGTHLYRIAIADVVRFEARNRRVRASAG